VLTLGSIARRNAELYGDKPAFVAGGASVSFAAHNERVNRLIHALRARGICKGDRVAILARNCIQYMDVYGAAEKAGFVAAPLNFRLTRHELAQVLARLQPRIVFAQAELADLVDGDVVVVDDDSYEALLATSSAEEPEGEVAPDDLCYLISTSGTTGMPRAAMLTHRGQWLNACALALEFGLDPTDRHLATMPLFHIGGRSHVLSHTLRGCTVVLHDGWDTAAVVADLERHRITTTQVVPTMVLWLLDEPDAGRRDLSSLRRVFYASAPMPVALLRRALDRFGSIFMQGYGQTESGPLATVLHAHEHELQGPGSGRLSSCGRAVPGVQVKIADAEGTELPRGEVGEVAIRSPFVMTGYWENPVASREALRGGWLYSGDMGRMDEEGYVYLSDRKKDLIISGGENIFPREVEEVLHSHPAVAEVAVLGEPDDTWGERVKAVVVLRADAVASEHELIAFCRERLARYKCPKVVEYRDELPHSATGKVLKRALREETRSVAS
jgi:O-succinylbenzoate-CoA ligase